MAVTKLYNENIDTILHVNDDVDATVVGVKVGNGVLHSMEFDSSANVSVAYWKGYVGAAIASISVTAPDLVIMLPAGSRVVVNIIDGLIFAGGLSEACVQTGGTAGSSAPTSNVLENMRLA